jgi:hypothetical protein
MKSIRTIIGILFLLAAALLWDLTKLHVTAYIIGSIGFMFLTFGFMKINL